MSSYCGVNGCKNNSKTKPHLSYFSLPKDEDRKRTWIQRMGREDLLTKETNSKHYVCSEHFSKESIKNKRLKSDAVPTLNMADPLGTNNHEDQQPELGHDTHVTIEIKKEPTAFSDADQSMECASPVPSSSQFQISSCRSIKRSSSSQSSHHSMLEEHFEQPPEASPLHQNKVHHHKSSELKHGYDEYDHFGLMIASKIRKIDNFEERETVMNVIQNIVFQSVMKTSASANTSS